MMWMMDDTWVVVVGALCAAACALPGCFLMLRGMSMMGDAISHAVLPGLAMGYLLSDSRSGLPMFVGAAVIGVLTAVFTQWVNRFGEVDRGAAMGIVFTTLFALGLVLIVRGADHVDLDADCVLYGAIEWTPWDTVPLFGVQVPRAAWVLGTVLAVNLLLVILLFKEFRISSFDPALASTLGYNATFMHYLLMVMVAVTTVASFEAVGSIIVIAMLVVPAATAYLLTDRLGVLLGLAMGFGVLSAGSGHVSAIVLPPLLGFEGTSTSGMMAVSAGVLFSLVRVFSASHGLWRRKREMSAARPRTRA